MARQLRILYSGAWYHVMNRGANHQALFFKKQHRKLFTDILEKISDVYRLEVHAYCLMTNHYHILLRTHEPNLPAAMQYLDGVFSKKLNKDMNRDGPLLRGRFKSILIEQDEYLLHVSRYIHLNPVEAGIVRAPEEYQWSSYPYYIGANKKPIWLYTDFVLNYFQGDNVFERYQNYTLAGNNAAIKKFYSAKYIKPILATREFIKKIRIDRSLSNEITSSEYQVIKCSLNEILEIVVKMSGSPREAIIKTARGQVNLLRSAFIYISRNISGHKIKNIATFLSECHYSTISATLSRFEKKLTESQELQSLIAICKMELVRRTKSS